MTRRLPGGAPRSAPCSIGYASLVSDSSRCRAPGEERSHRRVSSSRAISRYRLRAERPQRYIPFGLLACYRFFASRGRSTPGLARGEGSAAAHEPRDWKTCQLFVAVSRFRRRSRTSSANAAGTGNGVRSSSSSRCARVGLASTGRICANACFRVPALWGDGGLVLLVALAPRSRLNPALPFLPARAIITEDRRASALYVGRAPRGPPSALLRSAAFALCVSVVDARTSTGGRHAGLRGAAQHRALAQVSQRAR
jgi:hypothetical protein